MMHFLEVDIFNLFLKRRCYFFFLLISWFPDLLFWNISVFISHVAGTGIKIISICFSFCLLSCFLILLNIIIIFSTANSMVIL
jgi:hypothetical protein